jgi:hypothetical protein
MMIMYTPRHQETKLCSVCVSLSLYRSKEYLRVFTVPAVEVGEEHKDR